MLRRNSKHFFIPLIIKNIEDIYSLPSFKTIVLVPYKELYFSFQILPYSRIKIHQNWTSY